MELRQLAHFVAVADEGSFTRAAKRMHIVQSGISASIAALEKELGAALFRRSKYHVDLTAAGRALLPQARQSIAAAAAGRAAAIAASSSLDGRLHLGVPRSTPRRIQLTRVLREFHLEHPGVGLRISEISGADMNGLQDGTYDLLIGPPHSAPGITSVPLSQAPIMLVCALSHPLATRRSVRMQDLTDERFIDLPPGWISRTIADRALADAGIERRTSLEVDNIQLALKLVAEETGVALLPDVSSDYSAQVAFVPIRPTVGLVELSAQFIGDTPANPAARQFLDLLVAGPTDRRRRGDADADQ